MSEFTAKAERYVGVTSGGMDQAISIMGMPGIAKMVEFNPVGACALGLPAPAPAAVAGCGCSCGWLRLRLAAASFCCLVVVVCVCVWV